MGTQPTHARATIHVDSLPEDLVNDPHHLVAYGLFYRGDRPYIPVLVGVRLDGVRAEALRHRVSEWSASGVSGVCLEVGWSWHASGVQYQDDESAHIVAEAIGLAAQAGLDVWVMADVTDLPPGPVETPRGRSASQSTGDGPAFPNSDVRGRANRWLETLASSVAQGDRAHIAGFMIDTGVKPTSSHSWLRDRADNALLFEWRSWLRRRYDSDIAIAREWVRPGLTRDGASPPDLRALDTSARGKEAPSPMARFVSRVSNWLGRREFELTAGSFWPEPGKSRRGTEAPGGRTARELSPGQFADWHEFVGHVRSTYSLELRKTVSLALPSVPCVMLESGWAGLPGVGVVNSAVKGSDTEFLQGIACTEAQVPDVAWVASSLVGRSDDDHPPMISVADRGGTNGGRVASLAVAVGEGMVSLMISETWMADPEIKAFIAFVAAHEDELVASTHLADPVVWIDDPAYAGADPDDIATVGVSGTSLRWREDRASLFMAVRLAGFQVTVSDVDRFGSGPDGEETVAAIFPARRWIDLERYGRLVVHTLRGGNLITFPAPPRRQRDGMAFRSTFLWPVALGREVLTATPVRVGGADLGSFDSAGYGVVYPAPLPNDVEPILQLLSAQPGTNVGETVAAYRAQVHDGTSTVVGFSRIGHDPGAGDEADHMAIRRWVTSLMESVPRRVHPSEELAVLTSIRLVPSGGSLVFVTNPAPSPTAGGLTIADPAAISAVDSPSLRIEFATSGASAVVSGTTVQVALPAFGAMVLRVW